jgi:hypothetical protein
LPRFAPLHAILCVRRLRLILRRLCAELDAKSVAMNVRAIDIVGRTLLDSRPSPNSSTMACRTGAETGLSWLIARRSRTRSASDVGKPCPQPPQTLGGAVASARSRSRLLATSSSPYFTHDASSCAATMI